jgi:CheY-like chemotaxis protein
MNAKILYVEDDVRNMNLVRKMLKLTDYQLLEAVNGNSGFETALNEVPDLILMDVNLPDVNGIEVIRDIKQSPSLQHIPIVALTADTSDQTVEDCLVAGSATVIHKPVSRFQLLDAIRRFTDASITESSGGQIMEHEQGTGLKKVLIVDDNPDLRVIFARTFDRRHFSVHVAVDGVEAIESMEKELPDVLILDLNMPRMSGFEVLKFVRQNQKTKDIKVVIVTGNAMAMRAPETEHADLLLVKPVNIGDLITLAQRLVPSQAALQ